MSYQSRSFTYLQLLVGIGLITAIIFLVAWLQAWKPEQIATVTSSVFSGLTVLFLIIDKVWFDKPSFVFAPRNSLTMLETDAPTKQPFLRFAIRNDGFRDANSLRIKMYILSKDLKEKSILTASLRSLTGGDKSISDIKILKVGEEIEAYLPLSSLINSTSQHGRTEGYIRIRAITAFGSTTLFYRYEQDFENIRFVWLGITIPFGFIFEIIYGLKNRPKPLSLSIPLNLGPVTQPSHRNNKTGALSYM